MTHRAPPMLRPASRLLAITALTWLAITGARAFETSGPDWPNTYLSRVQALALIQSLNADLLGNASATLTLDRWCASHELAPTGSKIIANRVRGADKPADAAIREMLGVGPDEPVVYRRVRLSCGDRVLSEADNWYVPALLTPAMNTELETTDTSFGRVVRPLNFSRTTLSAKMLWQPLPVGWEMAKQAPEAPAEPGKMAVPPFLFEHRAVLKLPDGRPFSALVETYTDQNLAFPAPR
jgi:hypothetical protein